MADAAAANCNFVGNPLHEEQLEIIEMLGQTLAKVVGPVFDKIASNLVDAFVKRADQVYGA